jgi:hypothetical protein
VQIYVRRCLPQSAPHRILQRLCRSSRKCGFDRLSGFADSSRFNAGFLQYGTGRYEGSWKLDNADKTIEMAVKTVNGEVADVKNLLTGTFLGVMDQGDGTMRLYPVDRKGYEESKGKADSGLEVMSVRLRKGA